MKNNLKAKFRWRTLLSRVVYKNSIITVKEDTIVRPDGDSRIYAFTSVPRTVGIVPVDKNLSIYLCKQYRHIFKDESWEIPRGIVEKNESIFVAAKRELQEEARLTSNNIVKIGTLRLSIGFTDEEATIFLAKDGTPILNNLDKEKEIIEVKKLSFNKACLLIEQNKIVDGLTVGAILKAKQVLGI